jgi:hypothetical protein
MSSERGRTDDDASALATAMIWSQASAAPGCTQRRTRVQSNANVEGRRWLLFHREGRNILRHNGIK